MISIIDKINEAVREEIANEPKRTYIGASSIGDPCRRKLWYGFNGYDGEPISEKLAVVFETGRQLESMIINYLLMAASYDKNMIITANFSCNFTVDFRGSADAVIEINGIHYILEIKTANNASFNKFKKNGLKLWNEQYYAQCQSYMGMSNIHQCILLAINKDTSEMHEEVVEYDEIYYGILKQKAKDIIEAKEPPPKVNDSPLFYLCGMCKFKSICHSEGG